jgi:hypothetical protein
VIWIRLSIHFEKRIWIFIHIFMMDLDWIDIPKNWIEQQPVDDTDVLKFGISFHTTFITNVTLKQFYIKGQSIV